MDNFWDLIEHKKSLAKETQHYVPKLIAAAWVAKNRKLYGFDHIKPLSPLTWDELKVHEPTDLKVIAKFLNTPVKDLATLNPSWKQAISPPGRTSLMRVPKGMGEKTEQWLASRPPQEKLNYISHRVRKGDTLSEIARAYNSNTRAIKTVNKIRNPRALKLGQTLIIPQTGTKTNVKRKTSKTKAALARLSRQSTPTVQKTSAPRAKAVKRANNSSTYRVRSGDTLWSIARRHQISVTKLKALNGRRTNQIKIGEVLRVL